MKVFKFFIILVFISMSFNSCTKVDLMDDDGVSQENIQSFGDDDEILEELDRD